MRLKRKFVVVVPEQTVCLNLNVMAGQLSPAVLPSVQARSRSRSRSWWGTWISLRCKARRLAEEAEQSIAKESSFNT